MIKSKFIHGRELTKWLWKRKILSCLVWHVPKYVQDKFNWIGPLSGKRDILAAKKGSGIKINKLEDAKKVEHIGTLRNDTKEIFLKRHGFNNLVPTHDDQRNANKAYSRTNRLMGNKKTRLKNDM